MNCQQKVEFHPGPAPAPALECYTSWPGGVCKARRQDDFMCQKQGLGQDSKDEVIFIHTTAPPEVPSRAEHFIYCWHAATIWT